MSETIFDRDPHAAKALALSETIINTAVAMVRYLKLVYPKKRIFRKIDRRPLKRIIRNRAKMAMLMTGPMSATQVAMIVSQPVPKFPPGRLESGVMSESGSETIMVKDGHIVIPVKGGQTT